MNGRLQSVLRSPLMRNNHLNNLNNVGGKHHRRRSSEMLPKMVQFDESSEDYRCLCSCFHIKTGTLCIAGMLNHFIFKIALYRYRTYPHSVLLSKCLACLSPTKACIRSFRQEIERLCLDSLYHNIRLLRHRHSNSVNYDWRCHEKYCRSVVVSFDYAILGDSRFVSSFGCWPNCNTYSVCHLLSNIKCSPI